MRADAAQPPTWCADSSKQVYSQEGSCHVRSWAARPPHLLAGSRGNLPFHISLTCAPRPRGQSQAQRGCVAYGRGTFTQSSEQAHGWQSPNRDACQRLRRYARLGFPSPGSPVAEGARSVATTGVCCVLSDTAIQLLQAPARARALKSARSDMAASEFACGTFAATALPAEAYIA